MMNRLSLLSETRGAVTIELALVATLLTTFVIGISDISGAYSKKVQIEQLAQRIVEKAQQNGYQPANQTTLESEATTAVAAAGVTGGSADVTDWLECTSSSGTVTVKAWTANCANSGDTYGR